MDPTSWVNPPSPSTDSTQAGTSSENTINLAPSPDVIIPAVNSSPSSTPHSSSDSSRTVSIVSFEFPTHQENITPHLTRAPQFKRFLIKRKTGNEISMETSITIDQNFLDSVFEKIAKKYSILKEVGNLVLYYPIKESSGSTREVAVVNDEFAAENIETFYLQTPEMSSLTVEVLSQKKKSRSPDPGEILYSATIRKYFSVDKSFYELLVSHKSIADKFLRRRKYLSLVMGKKCMNLLSPAHFFCHVRGCEKLLVLGSFSKFTLIVRHWKDHALKESIGKKVCANLIHRYTYLDKVKGGESFVAGKQLDDLFPELDNVEYERKSLALVNQGNNFFIEAETKFNARHLLVDNTVLVKIAEGDPDALSNIPEPIPIRAFGKKNSGVVKKMKRNTSKSSNSLGELSRTSSAALADNDIIEMTINNDVDMDDEIPSKRTKKPSAQAILSDETDTEDDV